MMYEKNMYITNDVGTIDIERTSTTKEEVISMSTKGMFSISVFVNKWHEKR